MKNRRDFLRNTLGLGAGLAAGPRLFSASQNSGASMDMEPMSHATKRSGSRIVSVETPDVPQLPWRVDGNVKEFHLIAEPVKQEIFPGRTVDLWGYNGSARRYWDFIFAAKDRRLERQLRHGGEQGVVGLAYHTADFGDGDNGDFVDCDLRNLAESIALGRLDFKPELIRVIAKRRRQRTNHDGRQFREKYSAQ